MSLLIQFDHAEMNSRVFQCLKSLTGILLTASSYFTSPPLRRRSQFVDEECIHDDVTLKNERRTVSALGPELCPRAPGVCAHGWSILVARSALFSHKFQNLRHLSRGQHQFSQHELSRTRILQS
jgi:hypothetical protein